MAYFARGWDWQSVFCIIQNPVQTLRLLKQKVRRPKHPWNKTSWRTKHPENKKISRIDIKIITWKDVLSLRTFCPTYVFFWMFCLHGRFVCRTFCPSGYFVPLDVLSLRAFCPWTLCLRTFCLRLCCLGTVLALAAFQFPVLRSRVWPIRNYLHYSRLLPCFLLVEFVAFPGR